MNKQFAYRLKTAIVDGKMTLPLVKVIECDTLESSIDYLWKAIEYWTPLVKRFDGLVSEFAYSGLMRLFPLDHGGMSEISPMTNIGVLHLYGRNDPIRIAVYGCDHDIRTVQAGRCFYKSSCQKCDYRYEIDSGD